MKAILKYLYLTLRHKWYILLIGRKFKVSWWRLIKHDWTKFLPSEFIHYGKQFYGGGYNNTEFTRAWLRHQNRHEHHWEYWVIRSNDRIPIFATGFIGMPIPAVREMVADWYAAHRAYMGSWPNNITQWEWLDENLPRIKDLMAGTSSWLCLVDILCKEGHIGPILRN